MKSVTLLRRAYLAHCTIGDLIIGNLNLATIEKPWRNNQPYESCIPEGDYHCDITNSPKFGHVYQVKDVPNRTHILFHVGNWATDVVGCIAVGRILSEQTYMVQESKAGLSEFHRALGGEPFELSIRQYRINQPYVSQ